MIQDNTRGRLRVPRAAAGVLALPAGRPVLSRPDRAAWGRWALRNLSEEVEQRRLFPWIAVCFGLGIVLFFKAEGRPALWAPALAALLFCGLAIRAHARPGTLAVCIGLAALFSGFAAAVVRTGSVETPALAAIVIAPVTGFIEAVEERPQGARIILRVTRIDGLPDAVKPERVRLTVRSAAGLAAGQHVAARARLLPPPQPARPGGYDFARDAYFRGIGAVGSALGPVRVAPAATPAPWRLRLEASVDEARNELTRRIASAVGGGAGAVAAALVTGKRGLIDEPTNEALRSAGIYHIVSISGLHMVLAAGSFFWLTRALLALSPGAALLWPIKKAAALAAMVGAVAYCVFSGSEVATVRSLVMTLVMLGAVLVDRPALSIRNCAIASLIVLAREPEALLGPSFQMSFGAVAALIAFASWLRPRLALGPSASPVDRAGQWVLRSLAGLLGTTLVATLATSPFAAYHFQTLTPFGLLGNALALPLVSLVVMPAGLVGVLAYPFGLDRPVWQVMGAAVGKVLEVSAWIGGFEGATFVVPALGHGALALLSVALVIGTLMASSLRWLALLPAGAGLALAATPERHDMFMDREGAGAAIRSGSGRLTIVGRPSDFVVEQWLRADGDERATTDPSLREGATCDRAGCVVEHLHGLTVAFVRHAAAFEEDCRRAAIVLTGLVAPKTCKPALLLDKAALRKHGALAVRITGGAFEIDSSAGTGDPRPWEDRGRTDRAAPAPDAEEAAETGRPLPGSEPRARKRPFSSGGRD
jgi:competence protein ComEC